MDEQQEAARAGATTVSIGDLSDLADGDVHTCTAGPYDVMVCRVAGKLYALEDNCSHADTTLSDGRLSGYMITCPLHGAQFDVRDGTHRTPPAYTGVRSFTVTESDDGAVLSLPTTEEREPDGGSDFGGMFRTR